MLVPRGDTPSPRQQERRSCQTRYVICPYKRACGRLTGKDPDWILRGPTSYTFEHVCLTESLPATVFSVDSWDASGNHTDAYAVSRHSRLPTDLYASKELMTQCQVKGIPLGKKFAVHFDASSVGTTGDAKGMSVDCWAMPM